MTDLPYGVSLRHQGTKVSGASWTDVIVNNGRPRGEPGDEWSDKLTVQSCKVEPEHDHHAGVWVYAGQGVWLTPEEASVVVVQMIRHIRRARAIERGENV